MSHVPGFSQAPVLLDSVGDEFTENCRIMAIIWYGTTTSGDDAEIKDRVTGEILWAAKTDTTATYLGISFSDINLGCAGFMASVLDAGTILVYIAQKA